MKNFVSKNQEWLKMFGTILAVAISTTWFMSSQMTSIKLAMHAMEGRINDKIHDVDSRLGNMIHEVDSRLGNMINTIDKRLTVVETVLILQGAPIRAITQAEAPNEVN